MSEITCKDCGAPIHWAEQGAEDRNGAWYHDNPNDTLWCRGEGMIEPYERAEV